MVRADNARNPPLWSTRSRKVGPSPAAAPPETATVAANSSGNAASTPSSTRTRARRNTARSSARHIEALTGQGDEEILEAGPFGADGPHADPGQDQLAAAFLHGRGVGAQGADHHAGPRRVDRRAGQAEPFEDGHR